MNMTNLKIRLAAAVACVATVVTGVCMTAQIYWAVPPIVIWTAGGLIILSALCGCLIVSRSIGTESSRLAIAVSRAAQGADVDFAQELGEGQLADTLRELTKNLDKYKGLAEGIIEGLPMPFLLVDTDERALFTNQATLDMVQAEGKVEDHLGRTLAEIFYNDSSRETAVGKAMHQGQVFRNLEVAIQGHKGGTRHVLANVYALNNKHGECIGGFCLYLDMTRLKEQEAALQQQTEVITRTANEANSISDQLASASEEISAQVEQSRHATEESRRLTAGVAVSVEQMNATVLEVASNASSAAEISSEAREQAEEGARIVTEAIEGISSLENQASKLAEDMNSLGKQAESIGGIMSVISDIADQTNLLALNAAIEAARAGDAGRGFAVVADEVRKLAEKTMDATRNVETNVGAIQKSAEANVLATKETVHVVTETVATTRRAGEALATIVELSSETSDNVRSIATAAEEQSAASEEIARSASDINVAADETSRAMHESAQAVTDLARLASNLRKIMNDISS